jgi:hypothetical protein
VVVVVMMVAVVVVVMPVAMVAMMMVMCASIMATQFVADFVDEVERPCLAAAFAPDKSVGQEKHADADCDGRTAVGFSLLGRREAHEDGQRECRHRSRE